MSDPPSDILRINPNAMSLRIQPAQNGFFVYPNVQDRPELEGTRIADKAWVATSLDTLTAILFDHFVDVEATMVARAEEKKV